MAASLCFSCILRKFCIAENLYFPSLYIPTLLIMGTFAAHSWELFSGAELSVVSALRVCILCSHTTQGSQEKDYSFYYQEGLGFSDP